MRKALVSCLGPSTNTTPLSELLNSSCPFEDMVEPIEEEDTSLLSSDQVQDDSPALSTSTGPLPQDELQQNHSQLNEEPSDGPADNAFVRELKTHLSARRATNPARDPLEPQTLPVYGEISPESESSDDQDPLSFSLAKYIRPPVPAQPSPRSRPLPSLRDTSTPSRFQHTDFEDDSSNSPIILLNRAPPPSVVLRGVRRIPPHRNPEPASSSSPIILLNRPQPPSVVLRGVHTHRSRRRRPPQPLTSPPLRKKASIGSRLLGLFKGRKKRQHHVEEETSDSESENESEEDELSQEEEDGPPEPPPRPWREGRIRGMGQRKGAFRHKTNRIPIPARDGSLPPSFARKSKNVTPLPIRSSSSSSSASLSSSSGRTKPTPPIPLAASNRNRLMHSSEFNDEDEEDDEVEWNGLFGIRLEEFGSRLPRSIRSLLSFVERHIETTGIFRRASNREVLDRAKERLERGKMLELRDGDVSNVLLAANLLKYFCRCLPEPLVSPDELLEENVIGMRDEDEAAERISQWIKVNIPPIRKTLLFRVLTILHSTSEAAERLGGERCNANALATVWWMNLFQCQEGGVGAGGSGVGMMGMLRKIGPLTSLTRLMIEKAKTIVLLFDDSNSNSN